MLRSPGADADLSASFLKERAVFENNESRVENLRINQFEARLRIARIDRFPAGAAENQREDHETQPVDEAELHHALHQADAADRSEWISSFLLKLVNLLPPERP